MNDSELRTLLARIDERTRATDEKVDGLAVQHREIASKMSENSKAIYATLDANYVRKDTHDAQIGGHKTWLAYLTTIFGVAGAALLGYFLNRMS